MSDEEESQPDICKFVHAATSLVVLTQSHNLQGHVGGIHHHFSRPPNCPGVVLTSYKPLLVYLQCGESYHHWHRRASLAPGFAQIVKLCSWHGKVTELHYSPQPLPSFNYLIPSGKFCRPAWELIVKAHCLPILSLSPPCLLPPQPSLLPP